MILIIYNKLFTKIKKLMIIHSQIFDVKSRRSLADYTCTYQTCSKINFDDLPSNCEDLFGAQAAILLQHDDVLSKARIIDSSGINNSNALTTFMGQAVMQYGTGSTFYLLCVQLKTNAEDDAKGMIVGDESAELSRFSKFVTYIQEELNEEEFDNGSLT